MLERLKIALRSWLRRRGIVIYRVRQPPPPPIHEEPWDALQVVRGGRPAAFWCPLDQCVAFNGFSFGPGGWHPFAAAAAEHGTGSHRAYAGSVLERFYAAWQPSNAREALIGCDPSGPRGLERLPSWAYLAPWSGLTPEEFIALQRESIAYENRTHGNARLAITDGYTHHGPVSPAKGEIEYRRLIAVFESLSRHGFDRAHGDIRVTLLRNGQYRRYLVIQGHHRCAAAAALGHTSVPATFSEPRLVDLSDVDHWPQVRSGLWAAAEAIQYFRHLIEFEALRWARERALAGAPVREPGRS